ncbi:MAG TPA: MFS transporter [Planctomycetota bacterium]|nr:MFS transporter [Planctomycetota bacterium]
MSDETAAATTPAPAVDERRSGLGVLLFVSISFGLSFGIYETLLPLYWDSRGMSFATMGWIWAVSAASVFLLRVHVGRLSDRFGRKLFYTISLGVSAATNFATPLLPNVLMQAALKTSREAAVLVRDVMHSTILYERDASTFMGSLGLTRGAEYACHGFGSLMAGLLAMAAATSGRPSYTAPLLLAAGLVLAANVVFTGFYPNVPPPATPLGTRQVSSIREIFSLDLPPKLWLLVAFTFIFNTGLITTHCFIMPIYFKNLLTGSGRFDETNVLLAVAVIMMLHRLTSGVPMMLIGPRLRKNLKGLFITFVFFEGVALAATPLIANLWLAIAVWLTHDLLGAGIWSPIQQAYIQKYSRPDSRGADVSKVLALGQFGGVLGPLLASTLLRHASQGAPFLVGGIIVSLSALILLKL